MWSKNWAKGYQWDPFSGWSLSGAGAVAEPRKLIIYASPWDRNENDVISRRKIFHSLCQDRHESPFYSQVMKEKVDAFHGLWEQHRKSQLALEEEWNEILQLESRIAELEKPNASLKSELFQKGWRQDGWDGSSDLHWRWCYARTSLEVNELERTKK